MSNRSIQLNDVLYNYLLEYSLRESSLLAQLRQETSTLKEANMQIAPEQGQLMAFLVKLIHAKRVLEVGVYTGYSSLSVALALPDDGQLLACDINETWTKIAQEYWKRAGISHKIDLRLAPALETMSKLAQSGYSQLFDFIFIDADKVNYDHYYEWALKLIRPHGLIMIDNVLWGGQVANPEAQDVDTQAIRNLNAKIVRDPRVDVSMLPVADGLTLIRRK